MHVQVSPYIVLLAISAFASFAASLITQKHSAAGSFPLRLLLFFMVAWSGSYAASLTNISLAAKDLWLNVTFISMAVVPVIYLIFVLEYTHREKWLTTLNISLMLLIPVISILLRWTNGYHHLVYRYYQAIPFEDTFTLYYVRGPWFYVGLAYSFIAILLSTVLLFISAIYTGPLLRSQYYKILLASLLPMPASLYSEVFFYNRTIIDLTPISFGLCSILFVYSFFRNQLLDLLPVARSRLVENMSDGVLVVDAQGRIVDVNPAMLNILDRNAASLLGKNVSEIMNNWTEMNSVIFRNDATRTELRLQHDPSRYMDLRMTPLFDESNRLSGRIIVSRDITDRKQVEKDLVYANDRMHTQLIEIGLLQNQLREQAIRDPLTDLFNRRYLDETLERELSRAERENYPLCIVMMDLDHFKDVNDLYGHEAGDVVLRSLAEKITEQCRHGDFACRYGGEEFVLVMPNICLDSTSKRAKELHLNIESMNVPYGRFNLSVTISMGIACYPTHGKTKEELLRAADKALYKAKHSGRNCVSIYEDIQSIG
jgi:diguanylate cyclase (GGDEF)-like protein/PAS domain S-box-containing protein